MEIKTVCVSMAICSLGVILIKKIKQGLLRGLSVVIGSVRWHKPLWMAVLLTKNQSVKQLYGVKYWLGWVTLLFIFSGGGFVLHHYSQVATVSFSVSKPQMLMQANHSKPAPLHLTFYQDSLNASVAPIDVFGRSVDDDMELSPKIEGHWRWQSDNHLVFTPQKAWPAGTRYRIRLKQQALTSSTTLNNSIEFFKTDPLRVEIESFKFQPSVISSDKNAIVAKLVFNYPLDEQQIKNHSQILLEQGSSYKALPFRVIMNKKNSRNAYIRAQQLPLTTQESFARLIINKGIEPLSGNPSIDSQKKTVVIPSVSDLFKITGIRTDVLRHSRTNEPFRVLRIETNLAVDNKQLSSALKVYSIPKFLHGKSNAHLWQGSSDKINEILNSGKVVNLNLFKQQQFSTSTVHLFRFDVSSRNYLAVNLEQGLVAENGFFLKRSVKRLLSLSALPKELHFLREGALLPLTDSKRIDVMSRGNKAVKFTVARIKPENLNQFVTQTGGSFQSPYFNNPYDFSWDNISQVFQKVYFLNREKMEKIQYTGMDLSPYLQQSSHHLGLFHMKAEAWDAVKNKPAGPQQQKMVLISNLGVILKHNQAGSRDVFVQSLLTGKPVSYVTIQVIAKNGETIFTTKTAKDGHGQLPDLSQYQHQKMPVALLLRHFDDVSFIPYDSSQGRLNYSRFNVGGRYYPNSNEKLKAFSLTGKGIYRPGETVHLGFVVKNQQWKNGSFIQKTKNIPLHLVIRTVNGKTVYSKDLSLTKDGLVTADFATTNITLPSHYRAELYWSKAANRQDYLGGVEFEVKDFQADTLKLKLETGASSHLAWIKPEELSIHAQLENLYGQHAAGNHLSANLTVSPVRLMFSTIPHYQFYDTYSDREKPVEYFNHKISVSDTDVTGRANISLDSIGPISHSMQFNLLVQAYEKGSGRAVAKSKQLIVSPADSLVGVNTAGSLDFVAVNSKRQLFFITVNQQLDKVDVNTLNLQVVELLKLPSLVEQVDGSYQYQLTRNEKIISSLPFKIDSHATSYQLPTDKPGRFAIRIYDSQQRLTSEIPFTIVGEGDHQLRKNAQLSLKLNKSVYDKNEFLQVAINAPYAGSGLITIESDKIHAYRWFTSQSSSMVQSIKIPPSVHGNAYVNVIWLRAREDEQFINPISYAVKSFKVRDEQQAIKISLHVPKKVKSGTTVELHYQTNKPSQLLLFGESEGVLQYSGYRTPNPLAYFLSKQRLTVETKQTLEYLMPKYHSPHASSFGGGQSVKQSIAHHINPFKNTIKKPTAFWSGILSANQSDQVYSINVPDSFNGSLRIMAIAVNDGAMGVASRQVMASNDIIISPNLPSFVAPNDEFEMAVNVSSGDNIIKPMTTKVSIDSDKLTVIGKNHYSVILKPEQESTVSFRLKAKNLLGIAKVRIDALSEQGSSIGKHSQLSADVSIRPVTHYQTMLKNGYHDKSMMKVEVDNPYYASGRQLMISTASSPAIFADGIEKAIRSQALDSTMNLSSRLLIAVSEHEQVITANDKNKTKIVTLIEKIMQRQNREGVFSNWLYQCHYCSDSVSIYAMDVLTIAKEAGYKMNSDSFDEGISYLQYLAGQTSHSLKQSKLQAYAIYVLTRNEIVTTNVLTHLINQLDNMQDKTWRKSLISVYLAASYQLLLQHEMADKLIRTYRVKNNKNIDNVQYVHVLARYFPQRFKRLGSDLFNDEIQWLNQRPISSQLVARVYQSLVDAWHQHKAVDSNLSVTVINGQGNKTNLVKKSALIKQRSYESDTRQIVLSSDNAPYYYQSLQAGYKRRPMPAQSHGVEAYQTIKQVNEKEGIKLGDIVTVTIGLRLLEDSLLKDNMTPHHIVLSSLLPAGFELVAGSISRNKFNWINQQQDRVLFSVDVSRRLVSFDYKIKATMPGSFTVPAVSAWDEESSKIWAIGKINRIKVS